VQPVEEPTLTTKGARSTIDSLAPIGMGATDTAGRVLASLGQAGPPPPQFSPSADVPNAGVLLALPALLSCGLLKNSTTHFQIPSGYYGLSSIFLLLSFLALARVKSIEGLRYCAPGEWGKVLGLDRAPEVRTMRTKLQILTQAGGVEKWSAVLCQEWMQSDPEATGVFYVDGHVRVYHGSQTALPRRYVSRQRLCLRGTTDYWVNALDAQPFFAVTKAVDPGLVNVLKEDIVPRLLHEAPALIDDDELDKNELLHRFTIVFDREGYSPSLFAHMKVLRIACLTYRKWPGSDWTVEEFTVESVTLSNGETVQMQLAERGVFLASGGIWVREIRRMTESGHQTAIISTDYMSERTRLAAAMFGRWSQENFFRYMKEHYGLEHLMTYSLESMSDTTKIVNPAHRELDSAVRRTGGLLGRRRATFAALLLQEPIEQKVVEKWEEKKATLLQEISQLEGELAEQKVKRKETPRHILISELPKEQQFQQLHPSSKHFIDTIKMITYRAETAMAQVVRDVLHRQDDARALLRAIYADEADIIPDNEEGILTIRLHHLANHSSAVAIRHLCNELNATETIFPETNLRLIYELGSNTNPWDQEV